MRTTISPDDDLENGGPPPSIQPFRLVTVSGGGPHPRLNLDRTSALIVADDEAQYGDPPLTHP